MTVRARAVLGVSVVAVLLAAGAVVLLHGTNLHVTAQFPQTVNLYPGDEVRMLGVQVGTVDTVVPAADHVDVTMSYDAQYPLPADATAAVITPTLVGVRYVQVGPVYTGGPRLADTATIPIGRTAVPLEWDAIRGQLTQLATELGPGGQGDLQGPLADALTTTSANLDGNGTAVHDTIHDVSALLSTLSSGRDDLFGTVSNLQTLVSTLKESDAAVGEFNGRLAQVSGVLADNRVALARALDALDTASPLIQKFVADNRTALAGTLKDLDGVAKTVADNRQGLADVLQRAPGAISDFYNIIDERSGSVTAALGTTNLRDPAAFVCGAGAGLLPGGLDNPDATNFCRDALGPMLQVLQMDNLPVRTSPPPLTENGGTQLDRQQPGGDLAGLVVPRGN